MSTANEQQPMQTAPAPAMQQAAKQMAIVHDNGAFSALLDTARFEHLQRVAKMFSESSLVPEQFRKNQANCFIAMQMALRLQVDPLMFMQSCYVVHGRPGIEAKLAIALANASGVFSDRISFRLEGEGQNRQCTAIAHDRNTGEKLEITVSMAMAKAEGWLDKSGSKWKTMPELMLRYRAAMFLIRVYAPEAILGLQSREELEDIESGPSYSSAPRSSRVMRSELTDELLPAPADPEPNRVIPEATEQPQAAAPAFDSRDFLNRAAKQIEAAATATDLESWAIEHEEQLLRLSSEDSDWINGVYNERYKKLTASTAKPGKAKQGRLIEEGQGESYHGAGM